MSTSKKSKFRLNSIPKVWNNFFYRSPNGSADPDSQWRLQSELQEHNPIYKMVGLTSGGTFLEQYEKGKSEAEKKILFLKFFRSEIVQNYLCDDIQMVTENDYQKWHKEQHLLASTVLKSKETHARLSRLFTNEKSKYADNASVISLDTIVVPYEEHPVKWKLSYRGAIGETPIHLLFLNGSSQHIKIAEIILEAYPQLAKDIYESYEYYGQTCLHFAIIQENSEAVKILLDTNEIDLHARARGKFFIPLNLKRGDVKLRKHKFQGYAYYGEFPLSFSASTGNTDIYDLLVKSGCDPLKKDRYGNNVLHLAVIHDQVDMYSHILKHPIIKPDPDQRNNNDLTPLALAAKLGKKQMFDAILEFSSREFWSFHTLTCSAFPLKSLDTIGPRGETDWNSALIMIIRGRKKGHLDLVSEGIVHKLLERKWKNFARAKFIRLLIGFIVQILFLCLALYFRPNEQSDLRYGTSSSDIARYVFEAIVVIICLIVICFAGQEIYLESLSGFWLNLTSIPSRIAYLISTVMLLVCVPIRFLELYNVEDWLLAIAVPGMWSYLSFFLRNSSQTGPYITMIFKISTTDLVRFLVIYAIAITTSSIAFFYQYEGETIQLFLTEGGTFMALFQMSLGEFDYPTILQGKYQSLTIFIFIIFMVIVHILLLNMLIAMVSRTFDKINEKSGKVWKRQWASMVVILERSQTCDTKIKLQRSYDRCLKTELDTVDSGASNVDNTSPAKVEERALLFIHHQTKTQTQRREKMKHNWQMGRKAIKIKKTIPKYSPKLQIKSSAGISDILYSEIDDSGGKDLGRFEKAYGIPSTSNRKLSYSGDEEDDCE